MHLMSSCNIGFQKFDGEMCHVETSIHYLIASWFWEPHHHDFLKKYSTFSKEEITGVLLCIMGDQDRTNVICWGLNTYIIVI